MRPQRKPSMTIHKNLATPPCFCIVPASLAEPLLSRSATIPKACIVIGCQMRVRTDRNNPWTDENTILTDFSLELC